VLTHVVDGADVGMVERRGEAGLALEPLEGIGIGQKVGREHLDRDLAVQPEILRPVHRAHSSRAELVEYPVVGDPLPDHREEPGPHEVAAVTMVKVRY
jgi:hypothetical protein